MMSGNVPLPRHLVCEFIDRKLSDDFNSISESFGGIENIRSHHEIDNTPQNQASIRSWIQNRQITPSSSPLQTVFNESYYEWTGIMIVYNQLRAQSMNTHFSEMGSSVTQNTTEIVVVRQMDSYASKISRGLYLNQDWANVFFTFPNSNERIPAHSYKLAAASSVFDQILSGSPAAVDHDIMIVGHTPDAFKEFLQFFYLDEITLKASTITDIIRLLHAYKMPNYIKLCGPFWLKHYDIENIDYVCLAYELAIKFRLTELQDRCEQTIASLFAEVMKTDCFLWCSFGVLGRILAFDSLLCNESSVFDACLDWARYKCKQNDKDENDAANLREYLIDSSNGANLLHKIRFVSFSRDEYLMHLDAIDALLVNSAERTDVARLVIGSTTDLKSNKFQTEPRKPFWNDERAIDHVLPKNEIGPEVDVAERYVHVLKVNQPVLFGGFYIVQMQTTNLNLDELICFNVTIEERRTGSGDIAKLIHATNVTVAENVNEFVQFKPHPIVMKPDYEYHIAFEFKKDRVHISFRNEVVEPHQEIQLSNSLTIQYRSGAGNKGRLLMKGFKLMPLSTRLPCQLNYFISD